MVPSNIINDVSKKIWSSRIRILSKSPFFAGILYDLKFYFSENEKLLSCDGKNIYINPNSFAKLSEKEVDICLLHELMHIVLKHPFKCMRKPNDHLYRLACDMVVNSNIINLLGYDNGNELIVNGRKLPHITPEKDEAYNHSTEEVYQMLVKAYPHLVGKTDDEEDDDDDDEADQNNQPQESDNMLIKDQVVRTMKIGKVTSNKSMRLYLRDDVTKDDEKSLKHTYQVLDSLNCFDSYHIELEMLYPVMTLPYYSDFVSYNDNIFDPLSIKLNSSLLEDIRKNAPALKDKELIKYEKDVYFNNLDISPDRYKYFDKLEKSLHFKDEKDIIHKIRNYIATSAVYNIHPQPCPKGMDEVLYFLEVSKEGMCVNFAEAAVAMYRYYGIPARFVTGILIKTKKDKTVDIYREDGHAWAEVYIDNIGWMMIDPTPVVANIKNSCGGGSGTFDSHSRWSNQKQGKSGAFNDEDDINEKILKGVEIAKMLNDKHVPKFARDFAFAVKNPELDWRELLNDFLQENVNDYSFTPSDKRFSDSEFILPDFNDKDFDPEKVIFMIDMSGSMSNKAVTDCLSEIKGAIDLYDGKLIGYVGLFDTDVEKYGPIEDFDEDFLNDVKGTGGTSFHCIFNYLNEKLEPGEDDAKLIILTDGECGYPSEEDAKRFNVVWIINNNHITPPWGKVIRMIKHDEEQ